MTNTEKLEDRIRALRLPQLGDATVAAHAVIQTLDPHTLAVVVFCGNNTALIEQAIRDGHTGITTITTANDVITVTV